MKSTRTENEIMQGAKIKERAADIWGWSSPAGQLRAQRRAQIFIELTKMDSTHRVLEIGCGTGVFTELVSRTGAGLTATDLSEDLLDVVRQRKLPGCVVSAADAHSLSYADNSFDIVFGSSILHHLEIDAALREIFRVLKAGGQIVFAEPNMMNPQIAIQKNIPFIKKLMGDTPDETAFFRWALKKKLILLGFKDVSVTPYDFLHPQTPGVLIPAFDAFLKKLEKIPIVKEFAGSLIIYGGK